MQPVEAVLENHASMSLAELESEIQERGRAIEVIRQELFKIRPLLDPKVLEKARQEMRLAPAHLNQRLSADPVAGMNLSDLEAKAALIAEEIELRKKGK